jgi:hypothetical protein
MNICRCVAACVTAIVGSLSHSAFARNTVTHVEARQALLKAVRFFHAEVSSHGGYVYSYSGDLTLREGEGKATTSMIWVQPPGTPTVGQAFLDAYEATDHPACLEAARDAADALIQGQLHSGGWHYYIECDPAKRRNYLYRYDNEKHLQNDPTSTSERMSTGGWDVWRKRKYKTNKTTLDDDTTQAALRLLMRIDQILQFKNQRIHEAASYGLASLMGTQYSNGGWSANFDRFPNKSPNPRLYPPKKASYPQSWSRTWPKEFTGCYVTNDDLVANTILTMLTAYDIYDQKRYLAAARKGGDFLLLAQMPDPQPAWAQQYDRNMHPVWDRAFEPPAISGLESQKILEILMLLYRKTANKKYLDALPPAISYFRKSLLTKGRLARFYELKTNRPLYFTRGPDRRHQMTYKCERLANNYAFIIDARLDSIEAEYQRLQSAGPSAPKPQETAQHGQVRSIIDSMDKRGAWVEHGRLVHHKIEPESGIIQSRTFANNVKILYEFLLALKG